MQYPKQASTLNRLIKIHLYIALSLVLLSCSSGQETEDISSFEVEHDIDSIVGSDFSGIVFIEKEEEEIQFSEAYGYKDLEQTDAIKLDDSFVIGSISKQITAALIVRDYEAGFLELSDPIGKYLVTLPKTWKDSVTIHHLLVHTSGISDKQSELNHLPGAEFHYSQYGYQLLAEVIESIHHNSFENVANLLFDAKGLNSVHYPRFISGDFINSFELDTNQRLSKVETSMENYPAAGAFISNGMDLVKWNRLLYSGKIVSQKGLELMSKHHETRQHPIFGKINYGYGLTFLEGEQNLCIGALGYAPGFVSANFYYPKTKTSLIVLSNKVEGLPDFNQIFEKHIQLINYLKNN